MPPTDPPAVQRLRRRSEAIIGLELTRLAGRARTLGPRDLAVVEEALNELVERLVLARLRTVPHRAAEVERLFDADADADADGDGADVGPAGVSGRGGGGAPRTGVAARACGRVPGS